MGILAFLRGRFLACPLPGKEDVEAMLWTHRSSLNFRDAPRTTTLPAWWDHAFEVELARLSHISWTPRNPALSHSDASARQSAVAGVNEAAKRRKTGGGTGRQL